MKIKLAYRPGGALAAGMRAAAGGGVGARGAHTLPLDAITLPDGLMVDEVQLLTGKYGEYGK